MTERLKFPDEPIRVPPAFGPQPFEGYTLRELTDDDLGDPDARNCQTCGGEGFEWCEDSNSAEGCWAPACDGEAHTCPNCYGSGDAKDQRFW